MSAVEENLCVKNNDATASEWRHTLLEATDTLTTLNTSTEKGFLVVGSQLRDVHTLTKETVAQLSSFLDNLSQTENTDSLSRFQDLTQRSVTYLDTLDKTSSLAITHLTTLEGLIATLPYAVKEFDRLVGQLRMMGMATRIENARLGFSNLGFEHLADAVSSLSEEIQKKAKEVLHNLKSIGEIISANDTKLKTVQTQNAHMQETVVHDMAFNLQLLKEKHETCANSLKLITERSTKALQDINNVVEAIQFHDITRQQIEHVITALSGVQSGATDSNLAEILTTCELQIVQLTEIANEFDKAILSINYSLSDISETVGSIDKESCEATGMSDDSHDTFLTILEKRLGSVVTVLQQGANTIKEMSLDIETIDSVIKKMQTYMGEMGNIGMEIELLSLNSRVKSAKTGNQGAALGIIAESIQHISTTAHEHINSVVEQISQLITVSDEMICVTQAHDKKIDTEENIHGMTEELNELVKTFHTMNASGTELLLSTEQTCQMLSKKIVAMMESIREHQNVASILTGITDKLQNIINIKEQDITDEERAQVVHKLEDLKQQYTMEKERKVHDTLFVTGTSPAVHTKETVPSSEYGNNVELF
jgi:hypothetical protein